MTSMEKLTQFFYKRLFRIANSVSGLGRNTQGVCMASVLHKFIRQPHYKNCVMSEKGRNRMVFL